MTKLISLDLSQPPGMAEGLEIQFSAVALPSVEIAPDQKESTERTKPDDGGINSPWGKKAEKVFFTELQSLYRKCLDELLKDPLALAGVVKLRNLYVEDRLDSLAYVCSTKSGNSTEVERKLHDCAARADPLLSRFELSPRISAEGKREALQILSELNLKPGAVDFIAPAFIARVCRGPASAESLARMERVETLYQQILERCAKVLAMEGPAIKKAVSKLVYAFPQKMRDQIAEELYQEGCFGVYRAIQNFDPTKDVFFHTYAASWIYESAQQCVYNSVRTIRVPVYLQKLCKQERAEDQQIDHLFQREFSRPPTPFERNSRKGEQHACLAQAKKFLTIGSLDREIGGDDGDSTLGSLIAAEESSSLELTEIRNLDQNRLAGAFEKLNEREREIISRRFGLTSGVEETLQQVADYFSVSVERVRQLQNRALQKLRSGFGRDFDPSVYSG